MKTDIDKSNLEELIAQKKTIGTYVFDEARSCFLGGAKVELYIAAVAENTFESTLYYFDGYEIWLDEGDKESFTGTEEQAKKMAVESFNSEPELFMGFPIFYPNVSCDLYIDE